jgi:GPH family glycoside/pentoside/hexuronide:cation symporter
VKIQFHRIDTNVVVGLLVREFCCSGTDVFAKVLAMYAGTRTPSMEPQWLAAGLSQMLAVVGRALVVVAGYMGSVPLMMAFTALAALGQGPWQGDMNAVIASCSEYTYLTQGKRIDGTMYSCTSLGVKIGGGIGTAVVGWMLELSGYVGRNATQPQSALDMMQFIYLWLPLIFDVLIMFVLSRMNVEGANKKLKAEKRITADEVTDSSDIN